MTSGYSAEKRQSRTSAENERNSALQGRKAQPNRRTENETERPRHTRAQRNITRDNLNEIEPNKENTNPSAIENTSKRKGATLGRIDRTAIRPLEVVRVKGGVDRTMLAIIVLLICFGSVMVFSASYAYAYIKFGDSFYFIRRQIGWVILGLIAMFVAMHVDYKIVKKFTELYFIVGTILLIIVLLYGVAAGAAQRWINIGGVSIQPSELMKLGIILMLAKYYEKYQKLTSDKNFWVSSVFGTFIPVIIIGFVCLLVLLENHFSGTIIMFLIGMVMVFASGSRLIWMGAAGGVFSVLVGILIFFTDYASKRIDTWLNPQNYSAQNEIWQTLQGMNAIGSGGIFGVGLGNSLQKHMFVSEPQNDFIFSIIAEELGLIGCIAVIGLFFAFIWRGYKIAMRTPDTFSGLVVIGIVSKVGIQAFLNIAVVTGSIPNTGIALPFFSYGGTFLTILLAEMGLLLSISRYSYQQK